MQDFLAKSTVLQYNFQMFKKYDFTIKHFMYLFKKNWQLYNFWENGGKIGSKGVKLATPWISILKAWAQLPPGVTKKWK